jgi:uncharacterized protein YlxW (UPF0749 family)
MKELRAQIAVGVVCVVLWLSLALQFRSVQANLNGVAPTQKSKELVEELKTVKEEKQRLQGEISAIEKQIKEIEEAESTQETLAKQIRSEIEKYKVLSGFKPVKGTGVVMVIDDPPADPEFPTDRSIIMDRYERLLEVVNRLNDAGAEAISINEQRIISRTEISLAGNNININAIPTAPPFIIKAIGNPDDLEATLNIRYGIVWQMKEKDGLQVAVKKQDEVLISGYTGTIKYRFAKPIEEKAQ